MKGLINLQNKNKQYFRCCLVRYLNPVDKNPVTITKSDGEFSQQLYFKGIKISVQKKYYARIEKRNRISAFGYENKNPLSVYNSKQNCEEHVDLLSILNQKSCIVL